MARFVRPQERALVTVLPHMTTTPYAKSSLGRSKTTERRGVLIAVHWQCLALPLCQHDPICSSMYELYHHLDAIVVSWNVQMYNMPWE